MQADTLIAWNGVRLTIPDCWEPRVAGSSHLIFEKEFQPLLQLRWYAPSGYSSRESQRLAAALAKQENPVEPQNSLSEPWQQLESRFHILAFSAGREGTPSGGAFSCPHCHTLFHFQVFPEKTALGQAIGDSLYSLSCHDHDDDLWRIQDFSLSLPPGFSLSHYSFAPGLTRLSFQAGRVRLEAARLAPADERLQHRTLVEILLAQAGAAGLNPVETEEQHVCEAVRSPGIFRRLLLRLRGDQPFVRGRLNHDPVHNRLLSLILSGPRPLPESLLPELADNYAIVQKKRESAPAHPH